MELYRLTLTKYTDSAFSGEGARRVGARWSPPGYPVVYCASSIALAVLETLVHTDQSVVPSHKVIRVGVPDTLRIDALNDEGLPADWRITPAPPGPAKTRLGMVKQPSKRSIIGAFGPGPPGEKLSDEPSPS